MKIRILHSTGIDGKRVKPGTVVDAPHLLAVDLIHRERAELVDGDVPAEVATESGPTFLASTETEPEPEPAAGRKRKS